MNPTDLAAPYAWLISAARSAIAAVMTSVVFTAPAWAASFDCTKARSATERMICATPQLSSLDEELSSSYAVALIKATNKDQLKASQRWWLAQVRNSCSTVDCLVQAYTSRLTAMNDSLNENFTPPPASAALTAREAAACRAVVEASNHGQLEKYIQHATGPQMSAEQLRKIFGPDALVDGSEEYWSIDLDDDGVLDHFFISTQGTAHVTFAMGRLSRKGSAPTLLDASGELLADHILLRIVGSYYVVTVGEGPEALWKWRKNGQLERLCEFPRLAPVITLTPASTHSVCMALTQGRTKAVDYPLEQSIGALTDERFFSGVRVLDGLARVDLNNDGKLDSVVRVEMSHGAGRGCDTEYLATTDDTQTSVPDTALNKLLLSDIGGFACGPRMSALIFSGKVFVDTIQRNDDRIVFQINGVKATPVCTWRYQVMNEARLLNSVEKP